MSPRKLAVCEECFDGRKTWMELKDYYKETEEEVRQGYEERNDPWRHRVVRSGRRALRCVNA